MNFADLYQEVVLDHSKRPRNFGPLPNATATAMGDNPSCGDEVELALKVTPSGIEAIKFTGHGCAICMASASLMTLKVRGSQPAQALKLADDFRHMLTDPGEVTPPDELGDLQVFSAVRRFPQRVKCATLAWRALEQALTASVQAPVSTEEPDGT